MTYDEISFYRTIADSAFYAAAELDREIRGVKSFVVHRVEAFLQQFETAREFGSDIIRTQALLRIFREVIDPTAADRMQVTADLNRELEEFVRRTRSVVAGRGIEGLFAARDICLRVHSFCLAVSPSGPFEEELRA